MSRLWDKYAHRTYTSLCKMAEHEQKTKEWDEIDPTFAEARNLIDHLRNALDKAESERDALRMALIAMKDKYGR